jgi:hypothetical protein
MMGDEINASLESNFLSISTEVQYSRLTAQIDVNINKTKGYFGEAEESIAYYL